MPRFLPVILTRHILSRISRRLQERPRRTFSGKRSIGKDRSSFSTGVSYQQAVFIARGSLFIQEREVEKILFKNECHTDWVSTVRFSPSNTNPVIVSAGWDRIVKVWNLGTCQLKTNHIGHGGYINSVTVSPDGSLCASGGKVC